MSMTKSIATKSLSALLFAGIAVSGLAGTASAQTREHILLARQVGLATPEDDGGTAIVVLRWEKLRVP